ncbi:MAG: MFS transporter [Clostridiales bacterium]|nr:MFS transporter [Clostridiales bacterium]
MTRSKLSGKFWFALTTFSLIGQVAWIVENMYLNVFIYKMFNASAADISAMVTASSIAATLTTVFIGALSDKLGKRKVFMCMGYILWGVSIFSFVALNTQTLGTLFPMAVSVTSLGVTLTILLDCVMTFFGSAANDAAFNAWLTDSTDSTNRGAAEGINSMMPLVSMLLVFGGFMFFDLNRSQSWTIIFTVIGAIVTVIGILGFFIIKDNAAAPSDSGYFNNVPWLFAFNGKSKQILLQNTFVLRDFLYIHTSIYALSHTLLRGISGYCKLRADTCSCSNTCGGGNLLLGKGI